MQEKFKKQLGLRISFPEQGSGNSNDGNTARRFFQNIETVSKITGIVYL